MKFTIKKDGQDIELEVVSPSVKIRNEADTLRAKAVIRNIKDKVLIRLGLDAALKEQGYWSEEKDKEIEGLGRQLRDYELTLRRGGISLWGEARAIALKMRDLREEITNLYSKKNALDSYTAEGMADAEIIPFLLSKCVLQDGKPYFKNVDEVVERAGEEGYSDISFNFTKVYYNWSPEDITQRFENKFLIDNNLAKVVDLKGEKAVILINKEGQSTDEEGRLIDDKFRYIDADGALIDRWGNKVDEEGNLVVEAKPFTD